MLQLLGKPTQLEVVCRSLSSRSEKAKVNAEHLEEGESTMPVDGNGEIRRSGSSDLPNRAGCVKTHLASAGAAALVAFVLASLRLLREAPPFLH